MRGCGVGENSVRLGYSSDAIHPHGHPCLADEGEQLYTESQQRVHTLWDELATFEASRNDAALVHLLTAVADLVGAQNAYWFGAVRRADAEGDPLLGWRPRGIRYLHPPANDANFTRDRIRSLDRGGVDEATVAQARQAGAYRANRLCDLVSDAWFESDWYQAYRDRGVYDSLVVAVPVTSTTEGYYGFLMTAPDRRFSDEDRRTALYAMRGLAWFHRQVLLANGLLVSRTPLTPIQQRVAALLLTDRPEKDIANVLGVSPSSAHTYVRDVLRKFGVSGRKGLTALWLGSQA